MDFNNLKAFLQQRKELDEVPGRNKIPSAEELQGMPEDLKNVVLKNELNQAGAISPTNFLGSGIMAHEPEVKQNVAMGNELSQQISDDKEKKTDPFFELKRKLLYKAPEPTPSIHQPIDLGNTADMANNIAVKKLADDAIGDKKTDGDSITPTDSPIDLVAGGLGSRLGGVMARDAGGILGNEIGSVGYIPEGASMSASKNKLATMREKLVPVLHEKGIIGQGAGSIADEATINKHLLDIAQRGAETGKVFNAFDTNVAMQQAGPTTLAADRYASSMNNKFSALKNKLKP